MRYCLVNMTKTGCGMQFISPAPARSACWLKTLVFHSIWCQVTYVNLSFLYRLPFKPFVMHLHYYRALKLIGIKRSNEKLYWMRSMSNVNSDHVLLVVFAWKVTRNKYFGEAALRGGRACCTGNKAYLPDVDVISLGQRRRPPPCLHTAHSNITSTS